MKTDILLQEVKKIPEIEMEVIWYLNEYKGVQPWESIVNEIYVDFDIAMPYTNDIIGKKILITFCLLLHDCELEQDDIPGTYRIFISDTGYLDEIKDVSIFMIHSLGNLIEHYYQANEKKILNKFEKGLAYKIFEWNCSSFVKQEEVRVLIDKYTLAETAKMAMVKVDLISEILNDYYVRMNKKKFNNLERFLTKVEKVFESDPKLKENTQYLNYILEQIKNGGVNVNEPSDLFPIIKNVTLN
jgi:hypothetical protein